MRKLDELIKEFCPNGVEFKPLEECCVSLDNKRKPVTKAAREEGEYPYYGANGVQDYVSDYIFDGTFVLVGEDGSVITDRGTPIVNWAEGKIWVNNHAHIISEKEGVSLRYLYHVLQTLDVKPLIHGNIPKLTGKDFKALSIPVPPLEVQREIVHILDEFTLLSAELQAHKKQYEYYRNELLTYDKKIPSKKLIEVAEIQRGTRVVKSELSETGKYPVYQNALTPLGYYEEKNRLANNTFMICAGAAGQIGYSEVDFWAADDCYTFKCKEELNNRYLFHVLKNNQYRIDSKVRRASIPRISREAVAGLQVPVPSLDVQDKIVEVLDSFETICNDLSIGLPAEIEARQKQYEFYRDQLLTFAETGSSILTDRQTKLD